MNLAIEKENLSAEEAMIRAEELNFWPQLLKFEDVFSMYQETDSKSFLLDESNYQKLGRKLWKLVNEQRSRVTENVSISKSINCLLTYIEHIIETGTYSTHRCLGDLKRCFSTLRQLDGVDDIKSDANNDSDDPTCLPACLGNIDSPEENLFHLATLFIGFQDAWCICNHHELFYHTN